MAGLFQPVENTAEVQRVLHLPRREWTPEGNELLSQRLTPYLRTEGGQMFLKPIQALAISEFFEHRGLFGALPVGAGKTLLALLAFLVLPCKRPLLLIQANLLKDMMQAWGKLSLHWRIPKHIRVETYNKLWSPSGEHLLENYQPDLIVADEADNLRRIEDNAAVARMGRYLDPRPEVPFMALTGTITRKSILDFAHLLRWALRGRAPVPTDPRELDDWAGALDLGSTNPRHPGALLLFATPEDHAESRGSEAGAARRGFRRRMNQTPGVITVDEQSCDQPLRIRVFSAPQDPVLDEHFSRFRETGETPDGVELADALSMYNHEGPLGRGLYYRWNPPPPDEWRIKRKIWVRFVRWAIEKHKHYPPHLDTEFTVARHYRDRPEHTEWKAIKGEYDPSKHSEPVWIAGSVLQWVLNWIHVNSPALVWVQEVAFGEALAMCSGLRFYGAKGEDREGNFIGNHDARKTAILSNASNKRGRNLQAFTRNLYVGMSASATENEQKAGRTHRQGQDKPVGIDVLLCSSVDERNFYAAYAEANYVKQVQGLTQKLLIADLDLSNFKRDPLADRWFKPEKEDR